MSKKEYIVALDQGTTSSRAVLYDLAGQELKQSSVELAAQFPQDAWVEQDAREIWSTQLKALTDVTAGVSARDIKAIGITNQRETLVAWDPRSGEPLAPAIVWQCRRSAEICNRLRKEGLQDLISSRTGLVIDSYFSASKILWLFENIPGLRKKAELGQAVFGTVDSWLLYNLTAASGKAVFATEPSNASRTMLYGIDAGDWDDELLKIFSLRRENLAEIKPSHSAFGCTTVLGEAVPIRGILGDQQASLLGHGCVTENSVKCTFGTGAFLLLNTGQVRRTSQSGLLNSAAWNLEQSSTGGLPAEKITSYVVEGSIFIAGALIQWLRDNLGIIVSSAESEQKAARVADSGGVVIVPAFVGLGAPYWDENVRGAIFGLTRDTSIEHLVRASLEAVSQQVADLLEAPEFSSVSSLKIDGGMSKNGVFCQILADLTGLNIEVPPSSELTALGAARIAALGVCASDSLEQLVEEFGAAKALEHTCYHPIDSKGSVRIAARKKWKEAISRVQA